MSRRLGDAGETLLEIVIAVMIMGIGTTAILGSLGTSIGATRIHRQEALTGRILGNFAEYMKNETTSGYKPCTGAAAASAYDTDKAAFLALAGNASSSLYEPTMSNYTVTVDPTKVGSATPGSTTYTTCSSATPDTGIQLLTLRVTSNDGSAASSVDIVKWQR